MPQERDEHGRFVGGGGESSHTEQSYSPRRSASRDSEPENDIAYGSEHYENKPPPTDRDSSFDEPKTPPKGTRGNLISWVASKIKKRRG